MPLTHKEFQIRMSEVAKNYTSSPEVLEKISRISLLLATGPAGSGKSSIAKTAKFPRVVSSTTRPTREENGKTEVNGVNYNFEYPVGFLERAKMGQYLQIALGSDGENYYGSNSNSYPKGGVAFMDVVTGSVPGMLEFPFEQVAPLHIVPPSLDALLERLDNRGELPAHQRAARLREAKVSVADALNGNGGKVKEYGFVLNDDLDEAAATLQQIALPRGFDNYTGSAADARARKIAQKIFDDLDRFVIR